MHAYQMMLVARGGLEPPNFAVKERCRNHLANAHYIQDRPWICTTDCAHKQLLASTIFRDTSYDFQLLSEKLT